MPARTQILVPVFAMAAWTGLVLVLLAYARVSTSLVQQISPKEYALGESDAVPMAALKVNRNYMNLLELPVLFYVACLTAYASNTSSSLIVGTAWLYFALRVVHTGIHVTYNRVLHRFGVFAASNVVLAVLWVQLALQVFHQE